MMQVDLEKCTGCGYCLDACPNEAISMLEGKAVIDADTCLSCGACVETCPVGAITEIILPIPINRSLQPANLQSHIQPASRLAWTKPVLSFVGNEIVPKLMDTLISALDRRLSVPKETRVPAITAGAVLASGSQRQRRMRRRGRKFD